MAFPLAFMLVVALPASLRPKRGFVADTRNGTCADPSLLSNTGWYCEQDPKRTNCTLHNTRFQPPFRLAPRSMYLFTQQFLTQCTLFIQRLS